MESEIYRHPTLWEHKGGQTNPSWPRSCFSTGSVKNRDCGKILLANTWECKPENQDRSKGGSCRRNKCKDEGVHCPFGYNFMRKYGRLFFFSHHLEKETHKKYQLPVLRILHEVEEGRIFFPVAFSCFCLPLVKIYQLLDYVIRLPWARFPRGPVKLCQLS